MRHSVTELREAIRGLHPGTSIQHSERQAPYLSDSTGAARDRAHDENPPTPVRQRPREAVRRGALRCASRLEVTVPPAHSSRKAPHVLPREGGRRASCPARCRRAELKPSPARQRSISELARHRCISAASPHREHSSNVGGSGRRHTPTVHDRLESLITLRGIRNWRDHLPPWGGFSIKISRAENKNTLWLTSRVLHSIRGVN